MTLKKTITSSMNNVYLIGFRGAGKSTLAPVLAERLGWTAIEMDQQIEGSAGASITEIFARQGEEAFRQYETEVLGEVARGVGQVVSTGGGIVLREQNRQIMRNSGRVVWLQASAEATYQRLQLDEHQRPPLTAHPMREEIEQLLAQRRPLYDAACHFAVDTETHKLNEVVNIILSQMNRN